MRNDIVKYKALIEKLGIKKKKKRGVSNKKKHSFFLSPSNILLPFT